jgi:hypothetical protein
MWLIPEAIAVGIWVEHEPNCAPESNSTHIQQADTLRNERSEVKLAASPNTA